MDYPPLRNACPECQVLLVDAGDEFACPNCGIVEQKGPVAESRGIGGSEPVSGGLGSYMGPLLATGKEKGMRGISGSNTRYEYIKKISDHTGRQDGGTETCEKMIKRVGEKLGLPSIVMEQATSMAGTILSKRKGRRRTTMASVSTYCLIAACKIEGNTSANVGEIMAAHRALGRSVSSSSIIQLMLESPFKTRARAPEDYLGMVAARLSSNKRLLKKTTEEKASLTSYLNSLRETASELLRTMNRSSIVGKRPCAVAASAIYSAEVVLSIRSSRNRWLTQREVAECSDAAEYTIREQCANLFMPVVLVVARKTRTSPLAVPC